MQSRTRINVLIFGKQQWKDTSMNVLTSLGTQLEDETGREISPRRNRTNLLLFLLFWVAAGPFHPLPNSLSPPPPSSGSLDIRETVSRGAFREERRERGGDNANSSVCLPRPLTLLPHSTLLRKRTALHGKKKVPR